MRSSCRGSIRLCAALVALVVVLTPVLALSEEEEREALRVLAEHPSGLPGSIGTFDFANDNFNFFVYMTLFVGTVLLVFCAPTS